MSRDVLNNRLGAFDADANSKRTVGIASTILGGAALATGVTLLIVDLSSHHAPASARTVQPVFDLSYAGLSGVF